MNELVMVAEDEKEISEILVAYLDREGFRTVHASNGKVALELHLALKPDLVLLDVRMPLMDGWEVLSELRRRGSTPVIMLTALDQDIDKLQGLRIGADDYVVKPFNPVEVVARTRAVLRRSQPGAQVKSLNVGPVQIDMEAHLVTVNDKRNRSLSLPLTLTEFNLLVHMARNPKRVFSRAELVDACLSEGEALERTVDSHLSKLRRKLEDAGATGFLSNVRGVGYRLSTSL
jgi:two-component system response regulator AdeR